MKKGGSTSKAERIQRQTSNQTTAFNNHQTTFFITLCLSDQSFRIMQVKFGGAWWGNLSNLKWVQIGGQ
jgi:hypothetical protein